MNRGGAESMLMSLYRRLDRTRVQFDFLEFTDGPSDFSSEIEELGGRVLKCSWSQNPARILSTHNKIVNLLIDEGPYAAVHSHTLFSTGIVLAAARAAGISIRIAHSHNTSDTGNGLAAVSYRRVARWLIQRNSTSIVACSKDAGRYLFGPRFIEKGGLVVPNAVDLLRYRPRSSTGHQSSRISTARISLVSVARLEPVKNHGFLLELAEELRTREINFVMNFVGTGSLQTSLETAIAEKGLGDRVTMFGVREDVDEILRNSDALLMPSLWEGLPVALVEAQATGLHCIVSDTISRDADLGLELLNFLPLSSVSVWADSIEEEYPSRPTSEEIKNSLEAQGYTISASLAKLLPLYGI